MTKSFNESTTSDEYEECVMCSKGTGVRVDEHIENRKYYIEGAGQLCEKCYALT